MRRINEKEQLAKRLEADAKDVRSEADLLKEQAMEQMGLEGISTVKCDGRVFYISRTRSISVPADNREEVLRLARERGWDIGTVNTMKLKSLLVGEIEDLEPGQAQPASILGGTEFDGLVSEYQALQLRSRSS